MRPKSARRTRQLLAGTLATALAVGGVFAGVYTPLRALGLAVGIVSAVSIVPLVMLMGWGEPRPPWGLTLVGAVLGTIVMVGATALGFLPWMNGDSITVPSMAGALAGLLLTLPLPALGAVIGYEAGLDPAPPPRVALVPVNGGMMAALTAVF